MRENSWRFCIYVLILRITKVVGMCTYYQYDILSYLLSSHSVRMPEILLTCLMHCQDYYSLTLYILIWINLGMTPCKDLSKVDLLYVLSSLDTEKVEKMVNFCERQNVFF